MAKQDINYGAAPNDRTGDSLREAFRKSKQNFDELYGRVDFQAGTLAARPAAADAASMVYLVTDSTPPGAVYRSDGAAWKILDAVPALACRFGLAAAQSIANNTVTKVAFNEARLDTDTMADTTNNEILIKTPGIYIGGVNITWGDNSAAERYARVDVYPNGVGIATFRRAANVNSEHAFPLPARRYNVGDTLELIVRQQSGVALNILTNSEIWVARIAP